MLTPVSSRATSVGPVKRSTPCSTATSPEMAKCYKMAILLSKQILWMCLGSSRLLDSRQYCYHLKVRVLKSQRRPRCRTIPKSLWRVKMVNSAWNESAAVTAGRRGRPRQFKDPTGATSEQKQRRWVNGRMDVLSRLLRPNLNHHLGVYSRAVTLKMGCEWNVWTACKREGCTEHAPRQHPRLAERSASLPAVTAETRAAVTASRYLLQTRYQMEQAEVSECITLHLHSSHSPTPRVSFLILFTRFPRDIDPLSVPSAQLSLHLGRLPLGLISPEWNDILAQQLVNVEGVRGLRRATARETVTHSIRRRLLLRRILTYSDVLSWIQN